VIERDELKVEDSLLETMVELQPHLKLNASDNLSTHIVDLSTIICYLGVGDSYASLIVGAT
jgi:hypothetical protein